MFLTASPKRIIDINNIINKSSSVKPKVNMTTKEPSRKHIKSINRSFYKANSNILANFIYLEKSSIIVITNQVTSAQNMGIIKEVLKNSGNIN